MAMLRTKYHPCEQVIHGPSGPVRCPCAAYRRVNGRFFCRTHGRSHKAHDGGMLPNGNQCVSCGPGNAA